MAYGAKKPTMIKKAPKGRKAFSTPAFKPEGLGASKPKGLGARAGKSFKRMPVASPHSIQGKRLSKRRK